MHAYKDHRRPILLSIPHASSYVPELLREIVTLSPKNLLEYVDLYTDKIYHIHGYHRIKGEVCRVFLDVNRAPDDIAKEYAMGENGVVVHRTQDGIEIYHELPSDDIVTELIQKYHDPYHETIDGLMGELQFIFDCHSYLAVGPPMKKDAGIRRPDFNIGNLHFSTCSREHTLFVRDFFQEKGFSVGINVPYKGGYVLAHHCHRRRIHSFLVPGMQIEISQGLYIEEKTLAPRNEKIVEMNALIQEMVDAFYAQFFVHSKGKA
jgi:N-formylglutamate deformylase